LLLEITLGIRVILSETYTTKDRLIEFRPTLTENLETENLRLIMIYFWWENDCGREMLQEDLGESTAEEASIKVDVPTP